MYSQQIDDAIQLQEQKQILSQLRTMLDQGTAKPIYKQLANAICELISNGTIKAGTQLPSYRQTANALKISNMTVKKAYEHLAQTRLIVTMPSRGTFVRHIDIDAKKDDINDKIIWLEHGISVLETAAIKLIRQTTLEAEKSADVIVIDTETTGLSVSEDESYFSSNGI